MAEKRSMKIKLNAFGVSRPGHRAEEWKMMWQKARASESEGAGRNVGISQYFLSVVFLEHHRAARPQG